MLEVEGLTKQYGAFRGVDEISFALEKGTTLGLLGPNGAGKSTIIRMLAGTLMPTGGRIRLSGSQAEPSSLAYKRQLGYLPETAPLYSHMTVDAYLRFVARIKGVPADKQRLRREQVLAECRLEDVADRLIGRLSKGYRQRVGLAQALINDPALLILDEPTAGLDPGQTAGFRTLVERMRGRRTVLLSTHLLPEVRALCSRVIIINEGRIAAQGEIDGLLEHHSSRRRFYLEISGPHRSVMEKLEALPGVESVALSGQTGEDRYAYSLLARCTPDVRGQLVGLLAENGWQLFELRSDRGDLETLFMNAVAGSQKR